MENLIAQAELYLKLVIWSYFSSVNIPDSNCSSIQTALKIIETNGIANFMSPQKAFFFLNKTVLTFFLFLLQNLCNRYSSEAPCQGASNNYHNIGFYRIIRKLFTAYKTLDKMLFQSKSIDIFLFLHKNICCGYSLEVPH